MSRVSIISILLGMLLTIGIINIILGILLILIMRRVSIGSYVLWGDAVQVSTTYGQKKH